jgi:hypothetical protein
MQIVYTHYLHIIIYKSKGCARGANNKAASRCYTGSVGSVWGSNAWSPDSAAWQCMGTGNQKLPQMLCYLHWRKMSKNAKTCTRVCCMWNFDTANKKGGEHQKMGQNQNTKSGCQMGYIQNLNCPAVSNKCYVAIVVTCPPDTSLPLLGGAMVAFSKRNESAPLWPSSQPTLPQGANRPNGQLLAPLTNHHRPW